MTDEAPFAKSTNADASHTYVTLSTADDWTFPVMRLGQLWMKDVLGNWRQVVITPNGKLEVLPL